MTTIKCPKCDTDIETLIYEAKELSIEKYDIEADEYEWDDTQLDSEQYMCPNCKGVIFNSEDEMLEHLKELGIKL